MNATATIGEQRLELLKVGEVAARLRVSPPTVYRRIQQGDIAAYRLGGSRCSPIRVDAAEVKRFLDLPPTHEGADAP